MINEIQNDADARMSKSIESLRQELTKVRTGRAHTSLLDSITVDYYGNETPLNQVANISILDSRTLSIQVWEKQMTPVVEKAIMKSDLGLNPSTSGDLMRIPLPPLTEETRKGLIKVVRNEGENAKVAIRNIRRDANGSLKELEKDKDISEDEERRGQDFVQKLTDKHVKAIDDILSVKEKDLMEI
ncbi:ribosome recycling factor [sulfur-oxidizing endosymbiont of Gigantopelta aegis]|uniref:ribosome recycling factor n=1 Tax=sulfur-oxidizing endosymbiont of Gigantopelta aegis TaxID=2794934 RepID=UPI0018DC0F65|nr:ribosome recycling factor [sulfur-oxidizing endosymbiont of Gigantopelta aegis]